MLAYYVYNNSALSNLPVLPTLHYAGYANTTDYKQIPLLMAREKMKKMYHSHEYTAKGGIYVGAQVLSRYLLSSSL